MEGILALAHHHPKFRRSRLRRTLFGQSAAPPEKKKKKRKSKDAAQNTRKTKKKNTRNEVAAEDLAILIDALPSKETPVPSE